MLQANNVFRNFNIAIKVLLILPALRDDYEHGGAHEDKLKTKLTT